VPFYAFGPLKIVPVRNLGSAGPSEGLPITVDCPLWDSLRSVYPWLALSALLLLRRNNRNRRAWAVLLSLLAVYGILHVVESRPDGPMTWYISIYVRSFVCDALRALALGVALLLAVSDRIRFRSSVLRRLLSILIVFVGGGAAVLLNAPLAVNNTIWVLAFALILFVAALGMSIIARLLRWVLGRTDLRWHAAVYLVLGVGPILLVHGARLLIGTYPAMLSTLNQVLLASIVSQIVFAPYFVFFCFAVLALLSPFHRQRLAHCFAKEPIGV
jgi:hypothetical protein